MAQSSYMNFNTDAKFWKHLQISQLSSLPVINDSGFIAFNTVSNTGVFSVADNEEDSGYGWKPVVHTVQEAFVGSAPSVSQNGGIVTVDFSKAWVDPSSGNCTKYTIVANVDARNTASTVTSFAVELPEAFDFTNSFLMTTVYKMDDKGNFDGEYSPKVTVYKRNNTTRYFVNFAFDDHVALAQIFKVMILFDKTATLTTSADDIIIGINSDDSNWAVSTTTIDRSTPTDYKNKTA